MGSLGDWPQLSASCVKCRDLCSCLRGRARLDASELGRRCLVDFLIGPVVDRCVMLLKCDDGAWREGRVVLLGSLLVLIMGSKIFLRVGCRLDIWLGGQ